jgi:hypothetical protein
MGSVFIIDFQEKIIPNESLQRTRKKQRASDLDVRHPDLMVQFHRKRQKGGSMFTNERKSFSFFWVLLPILILSGCSPLLGGKAFTYREPVTDPDIIVDIFVPQKVWQGTTLISDNHNLQRPRIVEVNMHGEIVWQYLVPEHLKQYTNPGFDAELLPNNNILFVLPRNGVYEIDRNGNVMWSYMDHKVSHDADRLPNGNTLVVWGGGDRISDAQVKEINPKGKIVWAWYAKDHFYKLPYKEIIYQGWTHTNGATRLPNGNTLISPRNFNFVVEVDSKGSVIRTLGQGLLFKQHDPSILHNGNLLAGSHRPWGAFASSIESYDAVEIDIRTAAIVWKFEWPKGGRLGNPRLGARNAKRLPNGNTLVQGGVRIVEVTAEGEIVWQLRLREEIENEVLSTKQNAQRRSFYKVERIAPH